MTDIQFVYFDLGKILLAFDHAIGFRGIAKELDVPVAKVQALLDEQGLRNRYESGQVTTDEFLDTIAKHFFPEQAMSPERRRRLFEVSGEIFWPIESMIGIIDRVRAKGIGVGILSNTCEIHWQAIQRGGFEVLKNPADVEVLSFRCGAMKPAVQIYEFAERACAAAPENILFIDDKEENIVAARARGWNAEHTFGGPEAIGVLERYRVV
ncbi:MAG: HAD family phosphatase [Planctomycetota bacterium]